DHYDGFEDRTGEDPVTVRVGAGEHGFRFDPPAISVATGTTVVFEWVDAVNEHNVEAEDGSWQNPEGLLDEVGHTYERTFEDPGTHRYKCWPHAGQGMKGAVFVEPEA
ncbi:MAG: halocyanin domain-containing protein, partial [Halobacteriota archaeon]